MITVSPVSDKTQSQFEKLFTQYYGELGCEDDVPHLLSEYVLPDLKAGLISADILFDGENFIGFIIYQLDDIDNEWCHREGWGDIREIFVLPQNRGQGLGKFLILTAEFRLKERGVNRATACPPKARKNSSKNADIKKSGSITKNSTVSYMKKPNSTRRATAERTAFKRQFPESPSSR